MIKICPICKKEFKAKKKLQKYCSYECSGKSRMTDLTGKKFGRWTVLKFSHIKNENYYWLCRCDCGTIKEVSYASLSSGSQSCGCLAKEVASNICTHKKSKTRIYKIWQRMKNRCYNENYLRYKDWGGRGIIICDEWLSDFMNFYNWAIKNGYNDNLTIDRIDNNGNYEPSNCRWATYKEQNCNTRQNVIITYKNKKQTLSEWCEELNLDYRTIHGRIHNNWDIEKAFNTPIRKLSKSKKVKCIETSIIYASTKNAENTTHIKMSYISNCCNGWVKTAGGYHWEYVE